MDDGRQPLPAEFDRLQAPSSAYAPRQVVTYLCTREHVMSVPFAADAEVPEVWDCRWPAGHKGDRGGRIVEVASGSRHRGPRSMGELAPPGPQGRLCQRAGT